MKFKKIYIEITNICNKNCSFCSKSNRKKREMTPLEFENIIKEIKKYTNYIYLHIKGEPLLHTNFENIIKICDDNNINVNITTNGSLLNNKKEIIKNCKSIRQINISTHSINDLDTINNILDSIDYINKERNIYFVFRYWLLENNLILKENKVLKQILNYYNVSKEKKSEVKKNKNIKISNTIYINKDEEFIWPSLDNKESFNKGFCNGLKTHIGILSDGTVVPCCLDGEGIINLGNIFENTLENILNSKRVQDMIKSFQNNKRNEDLCKKCSF